MHQNGGIIPSAHSRGTARHSTYTEGKKIQNWRGREGRGWGGWRCLGRNHNTMR